MPGLNQASSAVPGPITAPGKTPRRHTHLPKRQRPEEGEFPVRNGAPASPAACNDARRCVMEASGHSGKTEQEDILERHNKRTFWKDRTRKGQLEDQGPQLPSAIDKLRIASSTATSANKVNAVKAGIRQTKSKSQSATDDNRTFSKQ